MKKIFILFIRFYQKFISPLFPAKCRYYPTCSQYTLEAIQEYGAIKGTYLGIKRLFREYIRLNIDKINDNYDIIIIAKKKFGENIEDLKYKDIEKDLNRVFKNSKII